MIQNAVEFYFEILVAILFENFPFTLFRRNVLLQSTVIIISGSTADNTAVLRQCLIYLTPT